MQPPSLALPTLPRFLYREGNFLILACVKRLSTMPTATILGPSIKLSPLSLSPPQSAHIAHRRDYLSPYQGVYFSEEFVALITDCSYSAIYQSSLWVCLRYQWRSFLHPQTSKFGLWVYISSRSLAI